MMSYLTYLLVGWVFLHEIWPGRRAHYVNYENINNSNLDGMSLASFCQSRAVNTCTFLCKLSSLCTLFLELCLYVPDVHTCTCSFFLLLFNVYIFYSNLHSKKYFKYMAKEMCNPSNLRLFSIYIHVHVCFISVLSKHVGNYAFET